MVVRFGETIRQAIGLKPVAAILSYSLWLAPTNPATASRRSLAGPDTPSRPAHIKCSVDDLDVARIPLRIGKTGGPVDVAAPGVRPGESRSRHGIGDGGGESPPFAEIGCKVGDGHVLLKDRLPVRLVADGETVEIWPIMVPNVFGDGGVGGGVVKRGVGFQQAKRIDDLVDAGSPSEGKQAVYVRLAGDGDGGGDSTVVPPTRRCRMPRFWNREISGWLVALKKCSPAPSGRSVFMPKLNPMKSAGMAAPGAPGASLTVIGDCAPVALFASQHAQSREARTRPKPEGRNLSPKGRRRRTAALRGVARRRLHVFGFRNSEFLRPSVFGFRVSIWANVGLEPAHLMPAALPSEPTARMISLMSSLSRSLAARAMRQT